APADSAVGQTAAITRAHAATIDFRFITLGLHEYLRSRAASGCCPRRSVCDFKRPFGRTPCPATGQSHCGPVSRGDETFAASRAPWPEGRLRPPPERLLWRS